MRKENTLLRSKKKQALEFVRNQQFAAARDLYRRICSADRGDPDAWSMLGALEGRLGNAHGAAECCRKATALAPRHAGAQFNLGIALRDLGHREEAVEALQRTLALSPGHRDAVAALTHLLGGLGRFAEATELLRGALALNPGDAEMHTSLGAVLQTQGFLEEAVACHRRSIELDSRLAMAYDNLGTTLCAQGRHTEAIACYREGLVLRPPSVIMHSNLLLALHYLPDIADRDLLAEHCRWAEIHAGRDVQRHDHGNDRDPHRRLRVGYVSPDLRSHSVAHFIEPLLAAHDRKHVEVICYADVRAPDETTQRLEALADLWRFVPELSASDLAAQIVADRVDILVDLAGHTAGNRLTTFARRPAPIQVSYLGYPGTTGLTAMDYRFTDDLADPGGDGVFYTEALARIPDCFLCYQPSPDSPAVQAPPAKKDGYVTFGSFNNLAKITPHVVALWARLLHAVPGARLFVKNPSLTDTPTRERYRTLFESLGVDAARVILRGHTPTQAAHLALYGQVDIALDTFPYNGTTTTCEALWMGVPVITLAGSRHASRVGTSLLANVGLNELIAKDQDEYVAAAFSLARDLPRLARLRAGLRQRLMDSPVCDAPGFAKKIEEAYRRMWQQWCDLPR